MDETLRSPVQVTRPVPLGVPFLDLGGRSSEPPGQESTTGHQSLRGHWRPDTEHHQRKHKIVSLSFDRIMGG